jgi:hypothetical protein
VASAAREAQAASAARVEWLHQLQWAEHDLLSHHPEEPEIRNALARLTRVRRQIEASAGTSSTTAQLEAAVEGLNSKLGIGGERYHARTALLDAIHQQTRGFFAELEDLDGT